MGTDKPTKLLGGADQGIEDEVIRCVDDDQGHEYRARSTRSPGERVARCALTGRVSADVAPVRAAHRPIRATARLRRQWVGLPEIRGVTRRLFLSTLSQVGLDTEVGCNSIFQRSWWLDAVAPGAWDVVEVSSDKYGVDAWLPYVVRYESFGVKIIDMPALTTSLGPWVRQPSSPSPRKQLTHYMSILDRLAEALPEADLFRQNFHHSIPTALPFAQHGFDLRLAYTYLIDDVTSEDQVWHNISTSRRQDVQKAQRQLEVRHSDDIELFLHLNHMTFERQGKNSRWSDDYVRRIDAACRTNDARCILIAFDEHENAHGAHYLVYDRETTNGLMSGADPAFRSSNAGSLLMWEALRFASKESRSFNFSGGSLAGIEPFISSFGGRQTPYVTATRSSLGWRSAELARESARSLAKAPQRVRARAKPRLTPRR